MSEDTYQPREDTFLLEDVVLDYCENSMEILEVGVGSSYILDRVSDEYRTTTFATDLNESAVRSASNNRRHKAVLSSTSSCFSSESFDIIFFNFPYLKPSEDLSEDYSSRALSYTDGLMGEYLDNSERCLRNSGYSIFLISDKTPVDVGKQIENTDLTVIDKIGKNLFFEELQVYVTQKLIS